MTSKTEPLLPTADAPAEDASCGKVFALCISLIATTVGAGVLSVPISYAYVGSVPMGTAMLVFFGVLSAASLRFIDVAANLMNASSYLNLGERCFGRAGASAVLWSLLGLLGGAFVQLSIIVIDLTEMLLAETVYAATDDTPNRFVVTAVVLICAYPLCLPQQLLQLSFTSSLSVGCILFTCFCIISLSLDGEEAARLAAIRPADASSSADGAEATPSMWALAMPIFSLAFCSQFQIIEVSQSLPPQSRKAYLPLITYTAMGIACAIYALVGIVCYSMLQESALNYPNVLTAFGDVPLVACGSLAIAIVNFLKLPLVLLPLRALLLEHCDITPPPTGYAHALITLFMIAVLGVLATLAGNLAFAFQVAGSTAGVAVCFILPGMLFSKASRVSGAAELLLAQSAAAQQGRVLLGNVLSKSEAAGALMTILGLASGLICLWALFMA